MIESAKVQAVRSQPARVADGLGSPLMQATAWWPYPRLIAHRGGGTTAPENTLAGLRAARAAGLPGVEFDVMLAADGVAILMHDARLGRCVPGRGRVDRFSADYLQTLDAGSWRGLQFKGEPIPTLAQALDTLLALGLWANIEIKPAPGREARTGAVVARQVASWWQQHKTHTLPAPLLSSFSSVALHAAQRVAPEVARALLIDRIPRDAVARAQALAVRAVHARHDRLSPAWVENLHAAGLGVMAYTVNDPKQARKLLAWGVDALCTDRLDLSFQTDLRLAS